MSVSPFRTTNGPFVEVPVPMVPPSQSDSKKDLEDIPFEADIHEFPASESAETTERVKTQGGGLLRRLFKGRSERRLREEMLSAELQDLRASYAGLLHSTEEMREQFDSEKESRLSVTEVLSPFPAAVAGLEKMQTRQLETNEVLGNIRERLSQSDNRDKSLLSSLDSIDGGVGKLETEVGVVNVGVEKVNKVVSDIAEGQVEVSANLNKFDKKMESRFEEAAKSAKTNSERIEQSGDEVLQVLRQMERNSQRGLWIFATLIAVLFIALICFAANVSRLTSSSLIEPESAPAVETAQTADDSLVSAEPVGEVLSDDFEF